MASPARRRQGVAFPCRDVAQHVGAAGDDPVHAPVGQALHVFGCVDCPDHHAQLGRRGLPDQSRGLIAEIGRPERAAALIIAAATRLIGRIETGGLGRGLRQRDGGRPSPLQGQMDRGYFGRPFLDELQGSPVEGLDHDAAAKRLGLQHERTVRRAE